jgi:starch synthase
VEIIGLLDREKIYGYDDDTERFTAFQIAVVSWLNSWHHNPDVVHCHDHHTALVPFMMQHCLAFRNKLSGVKTILTIHNAQYQGWMGWDKSIYIPAWDSWKQGLLEWENTINPLASGIKCAWKVTTVSHSYMAELKYNSNGLEKLFEYEKGKCYGILNGIDNEVWNPKTDTYITNHFTVKTMVKGKQKNKEIICEKFGLKADLPMFVFIGRLVGEKAADILPAAFEAIMNTYYGQCCIVILGSGDPVVEWQLAGFNDRYKGYYYADIGYNESLSHLLYAGSDFLLMPSRVEPCGLNQMYSLRYGTLPIVRSTGGLQDTVKDMGELDGFGIRFNNATVGDLHYSVSRAIAVYKDKIRFNWMRKYMMQIDHSWEGTVAEYDKIYG